MKQAGKLISSRFFTPIFILAIFVLLIISTFAYRNTIELENSQDSIIRSYQIKSELRYLYQKLAEAKASQYEFLLTDKNESLKYYDEAKDKVDKSFRKLESYAQSSQEQAEQLNDLKWSVGAALYSLEDVLAFEQGSRAMLLKKISDSNVLLGSAKELIKEMLQKEENHIRETRLKHIKESSFTPFGSLLLVLFALLALVLFYYQINEDFARLRKMNRDLETTNSELSSFNHVTSHDLQEPLRKIETFISRLEEKDKQNLSDTGKQYLNKISSSASNMRKLIQDLLLFSQTNTTEREFETASLEVIIQEAKQELEIEIANKKGNIIIKNKLPEINCVPFQIRQLFINLIGNSLKYAKENVAPVIEITCSTFEPSAAEMPDLHGKKYHKISVKDNGIGFEQQYASKVFDLFERLHQKNEYSGSGIGLAICKKIAENHNGAISAEGIPAQGAVFHIYIPM